MLPQPFVYITLLDFTFLWDTIQNPTVIYTEFRWYPLQVISTIRLVSIDIPAADLTQDLRFWDVPVHRDSQ